MAVAPFSQAVREVAVFGFPRVERYVPVSHFPLPPSTPSTHTRACPKNVAAGCASDSDEGKDARITIISGDADVQLHTLAAIRGIASKFSISIINGLTDAIREDAGFFIGIGEYRQGELAEVSFGVAASRHVPPCCPFEEAEARSWSQR